jgi:hypothetical protein
MRSRRSLVFLSAGIVACALVAFGQDSPSLGDVARQARQQKQKDAAPTGSNPAPGAVPAGTDAETPSTSKDSQSAKPAKKVITNDEIPEHIGPTSTRPPGAQPVPASYPQPNRYEGKIPPEQWKAQILSLKNNMSSLQQSIGSLSASIQYAGANCVANCVQWNERQKQKQDQIENMKAQLEQAQKMLEDMQDAARKQGYGSAVYDP